MASLAMSSAKAAKRDEIYVAGIALRASKGPAQLLMSAAYSLNLWDLHHFMVLVKPSSSSQVLVFDFQPKDPENIYVALAALSARKIPGAVLTRMLIKLPKTKCWHVGSTETDAIGATYKFNESWLTDLRIGHHDCRDYTNGLVECLTGEINVLERLRKSGRS